MCLFVRNLTSQEGQRLQQIIRRGNSVVTVRRAEIVLGSAQGIRVPAIAENLHCHADHVRDVIHCFNEAGLDSLKPQWGGGRPARVADIGGGPGRVLLPRSSTATPPSVRTAHPASRGAVVHLLTIGRKE